jgi:capsular exopolysaccharide synthesis family protein
MTQNTSIPAPTVLQRIRRNWHFILIGLLVASAIAQAIILYRPVTYRATAAVRIGEPMVPTGTNAVQKDIQSEVEILRSRTLVEQALSQLDFGVSYFEIKPYTKEEVVSDAPFIVHWSNSSDQFRSCDFNFRHRNSHSYVLSYSVSGLEVEKNMEYGQEVEESGLRFSINKNEAVWEAYRSRFDKTWGFRLASPSVLAEEFLDGKIDVEVTGRDAQVARIHVTHELPLKAMRMANALAEAYVQYGIQSNEQMAANTAGFIDRQLNTVSTRLDSARRAMQSYREQNAIVNLPLETQTGYKALSDLEIRKTDIGMQLNVLERISDYIRLEKEVKISLSEYGNDLGPLFSDNVNRLNTIIREKSQAQANGETDTKNFDSEIVALRTTILDRIGMTRRRLILEQDELASAIGQQRSNFNTLPRKETEMQELARNYYLNEKIYNHLLEKRTETVVGMQLAYAGANILETAILPREPRTPNTQTIWAAALLLGLVFGTTSAAIRNRQPARVEVPEDLNCDSTIPVLGQVGKLGRNESAYKAFTALTTRILMNRTTDQPMVITVTSTRKGEGKSFVAAQLARTLAAQDKKVVLIDMNTVQPRLGEWFEARRMEGISDVFTRRISLQDSVQLTSIPNLDLITSGTVDHPIGHLIATTRTRELLDELRGQYDAVIVDTPEVGEYIDAIPFMKWSDLNLYVVKAESGRHELVANAEMVKEEYRLQEVYYVLNSMKARRNHTGYLAPLRQTGSKIRRMAPQLTNLFM